MTVLSQITSPADLKKLPAAALGTLAQEIREFLIARVSGAGGHLGSNLGVVELTMAVHRVFNSPCDVLLFDTGHQAYVHKILTGRCAEFGSLRQTGGRPATRPGPNPSMTSSKTRTPRPRCPTRTAWLKPSRWTAAPTGGWSPSSETGR
jgi:hypothetical protein